jgi:hypothetical protein
MAVADLRLLPEVTVRSAANARESSVRTNTKATRKVTTLIDHLPVPPTTREKQVLNPIFFPLEDKCWANRPPIVGGLVPSFGFRDGNLRRWCSYCYVLLTARSHDDTANYGSVEIVEPVTPRLMCGNGYMSAGLAASALPVRDVSLRELRSSDREGGCL